MRTPDLRQAKTAPRSIVTCLGGTMLFGCQLELEPVTLEPEDPIFVGSSTALLRELRNLQNVSQIELGSAPEGYEEMRADW
jgi:hypothetical protein